MRKYIIIVLALLPWALSAAPQEPLYIVNGEVHDQIRSIPPEQVESVRRLPADEQTIAAYGSEAMNGVLIVTLKHDTPAAFPDGESFDDYIASQVRWDDDETTARVILRYTVDVDGRTLVDKELESTDSKLKRRVLKALEEAPRWKPAMKNGSPIATQGILHVQLPAGKPMPREAVLVWR